MSRALRILMYALMDFYLNGVVPSACCLVRKSRSGGRKWAAALILMESIFSIGLPN